MLGYAHSKQHADGIHIRTYARTFIFTNAEDPRRRAVFVTLDVGKLTNIFFLLIMIIFS